MTVFAISAIERDAVVSDTVVYDIDFVLFYKDTVINPKLHDLLSSSHIDTIKTGKLPLPQKKVKTYDQIIAEIDDVEQESEADELLEKEVAKYTDDIHPSIIAKNLFSYSELLKITEDIVYRVKVQRRLLESDIQDFIYTQIIPKIQKNPHLYLAIGEFGILEDDKIQELKATSEPNPDLMLRRLMFCLAALFLDDSRMIMGIDLYAKISTAAFLADIGKIQILEKLHKKDIPNLDFTDEKLQLLIPRFSAQMLKHNMFSSDIVDGVQNIYSFMPKDPSALPSLKKTKDRFQFISISNTYISLIYSGISPPNALKMIINNSISLYNPEIIRNFVKIINIIPVGSYVQLKNGSIGFVYRKDKDYPKHPIVQLITNSNGTVRNRISYVQTTDDNLIINSFVQDSDIPNYRYLRLTQLKNLF